MEAQKKSWFDPYMLGDMQLKNRIIMAPLARMRCENREAGVPGELAKEYYSQRAGFGMIISECSPVSQQGNCFIGAGGIYTEEQVQGWKQVIDEVHKKGGVMCIQIWHCGRAIGEGTLPEGMPAWGASSNQIRCKNRFGQDYVKPHEMTKEEIQIVIGQYKQGAINAKKAGFDFIELHCANGYLMDQFLRDFSNQRKDEYGGSIENRCRFPLEVLDELIKVFGKERTGLRVSPTGRIGDMYDSDPLKLYSYFIKKADEKGIAFVEIKEAGKPINWDFTNEFQTDLPKAHDQMEDCCKLLKSFFSRTVISNDGFNCESGLQRINDGICNLVSFGRLAIANPDLPNRFKNGYSVNQPNPEFYFTSGRKGYSDYPTYEEEQQSKK